MLKHEEFRRGRRTPTPGRWLHRELELATQPDQGFGAPAGYRAYLRVRFHPRWGYPERYRRSVGGISNGVEIAVQRLTPSG